MGIIKVYATADREVYVMCPDCGKEFQIDLSTLTSSNIVEIECECGNRFSAFVDRRQFYRKSVDLKGVCFASGFPEEGVPIDIHDLSRTGLRFIKYGGRPLSKGDVLKIKFRLDDCSSAIVVMATVVTIEGDHIGTNITKLDDHTKKCLGFFLLP